MRPNLKIFASREGELIQPLAAQIGIHDLERAEGAEAKRASEPRVALLSSRLIGLGADACWV